MPDSVAHPDLPAKRRFATRARVACFLIGCLLIAAAVWAIARNHDKLSQAWDAAGHAPAFLIALCLLLPIVNWLCTTGTIWTLTGRYGKVGFGEMLGLIGSAWLLNLLPLRLGMVGRIAYHKKFHGIRVRDCAKVLFQALACSAGALGLLILCVLIVRTYLTDATGQTSDLPEVSHAELFGGATLRTLALLCIPLPVCLIAVAAIRFKIRKHGSLLAHAWRWPAAILFRYADMLTWMVRYALIFAVIGKPVPMMQAAIITTTAQAAMLTPVQFGLREWVVGATAAFLEKDDVKEKNRVDRTPLSERGGTQNPAPLGERGYASKTASLLDSATPGLMADVMMRAAELVIILPVGFLSTWWLWRRTNRVIVVSADN